MSLLSVYVTFIDSVLIKFRSCGTGIFQIIAATEKQKHEM